MERDVHDYLNEIDFIAQKAAREKNYNVDFILQYPVSDDLKEKFTHQYDEAYKIEEDKMKLSIMAYQRGAMNLALNIDYADCQIQKNRVIESIQTSFERYYTFGKKVFLWEVKGFSDGSQDKEEDLNLDMLKDFPKSVIDNASLAYKKAFDEGKQLGQKAYLYGYYKFFDDHILDVEDRLTDNIQEKNYDDFEEIKSEKIEDEKKEFLSTLSNESYKNELLNNALENGYKSACYVIEMFELGRKNRLQDEKWLARKTEDAMFEKALFLEHCQKAYLIGLNLFSNQTVYQKKDYLEFFNLASKNGFEQTECYFPIKSFYHWLSLDEPLEKIAECLYKEEMYCREYFFSYEMKNALGEVLSLYLNELDLDDKKLSYFELLKEQNEYINWLEEHYCSNRFFIKIQQEIFKFLLHASSINNVVKTILSEYSNVLSINYFASRISEYVVSSRHFKGSLNEQDFNAAGIEGIKIPNVDIPKILLPYYQFKHYDLYMKALMKRVENKYNQGKKEGFDKGYTEGHENGYSKGSEKGYHDGYNKGAENGYGNGYHDGYNNGSNDGFRKGYSIGLAS